MSTRFNTLLAVLLLATSLPAKAEFSANIGWVSDYYFRGIFQHASSASAGIDYAANGFYAGAWTADVGDGLEVDGYLGYGGEVEGFGYSIGFTGYYYTGDFDDTYEEINLSASYGIATIDIAIGEYDNFGGATQHYIFYGITLEKDGLYGSYNSFSEDFDSSYVEVGYGFDVEGVDFSLGLIVADDPATNETDEALFFGIAKSFEIN